MALAFQVRIGLLASAVLLPFLAYGAWLAQTSRGQAREHAIHEMRVMSELATHEREVAVHEARGVLGALKRAPAVREGGALCDELLAGALRSVRGVGELVVIDGSGGVRCGAPPSASPTRPEFDAVRQAALASMRTTLGVILGPDGGAAFADVTMDGSDAVGVIVARLRAPRKGDSGLLASLPEGSFAVLVNPVGRVVESLPPGEAPLGASVADLGIHPDLLQPGGGTFEDVLVRDRSHLVDVAPLAPAGGSPDGYLVAAVPSESAYTGAESLGGAIVFSGWVTVFVVLLSLGVAADRLLVRRMDRLTALADQLSVGGEAPPPDRHDAFDYLASVLQRLATGAERNGAPYREAVLHVSEGVLVLTASGRVLAANPAASRLLGRRQDQILGASVHVLLHGADAPHAEEDCPLTASTRDGRARRAGVEVLPRHGGESWCASWRSSVSEDGLSFAGSVLMLQDVGPAREVAGRLREATRLELLRRLGAGVIHDLANLLTTIGALADEQAGSGSPAARDSGREIVRATERAAVLLGQWRAMALPEEGPGPTDVNRVLSDLLPLFSRLWGDSVALTTQLDPAAGQASVGKGRVERLVLHVLALAPDAPAGRRIHLRTQRTGDTILLTVEHLAEEALDPVPGDDPTGPSTLERLAQEVRGSVSLERGPGRRSYRVRLPAAEVIQGTSQP